MKLVSCPRCGGDQVDDVGEHGDRGHRWWCGACNVVFTGSPNELLREFHQAEPVEPPAPACTRGAIDRARERLRGAA